MRLQLFSLTHTLLSPPHPPPPFTDKYHAITGLQQQHARAFAEQLKQRNIPFWLRYVLLPGYTDAPGDIQALIDFCREQPTLQGVELLPYHL